MLLKTIETRFCGPNNTRGSRIRASDGDNTIFVDYPHAMNHEQRHAFRRFHAGEETRLARLLLWWFGQEIKFLCLGNVRR